MNDDLGIIGKIFAYFFFAITAIVVFDIIFGDNSRKDIKNKRKIVTKVKVQNKRIAYDADNSRSYIIEFEGNNDIDFYYVKYKIYNKIKIGDIIDLEYSKNSFWVLKIKWNNIDIENSAYVK